MEEGAKRRLVGAAVIVVLLVIFLPMLLEEEPSRPLPEREMSIPPRPDFDQGYEASGLENPVEPSVSTFLEYEEPTQEDAPLPRELPPPALFEAPATTESKVTPEPPPVLVEERPPAAKPRPTPKPTPAPKPRPVSKPKPKPKPTPAPKPRPKPKPTPAPKAAPAAKPAPARPSTPARASTTSPSAWVIQVASLRERNRAYAMVQRLRAKGFPAYLEEARVKRELWHRVRIGPELERKRIESMAASLQKKMRLKGRIQRYP